MWDDPGLIKWLKYFPTTKSQQSTSYNLNTHDFCEGLKLHIYCLLLVEDSVGVDSQSACRILYRPVCPHALKIQALSIICHIVILSFSASHLMVTCTVKDLSPSTMARYMVWPEVVWAIQAWLSNNIHSMYSVPPENMINTEFHPMPYNWPLQPLLFDPTQWCALWLQMCHVTCVLHVHKHHPHCQGHKEFKI
jgi:hypothetical protein